MTVKKIFISFSGKLASDVGAVLKDYIEKTFTKKVEVFHDEFYIGSGRFVDQIRQNIKNAEVFIPILTEYNKNAPWLMFELGMAYFNDEFINKILPLCFYFDELNRNHPVNGLRVYFIPSNLNERRRNGMVDLFNQLTQLLNDDNECSKNYYLERYAKECEDKLKNLFEQHQKEKYRNNITENQTIIPFFRLEGLINKGNKLADLSGYFDKFVKECIEIDLHQPQEVEPYSSREKKFITNVILNGTRFSTFVCVTDKKNLLLFDRKKDPKFPLVKNARLDVLGSMDFANSSLKNKLGSVAEIDIEEITLIYGVALEDVIAEPEQNRQQKSTAVMLGMVVYVDEKRLQAAVEQAKNNLLILYALQQAAGLVNLTAKARLAIEHLLWLQNKKP